MIDKRYLIDRQGKTYVLYGGLLALAHELSGGRLSITTELQQVPSPQNAMVAVVSARARFWDEAGQIVREASGIGDASPRNVARGLEEATIRLAETRAKARALRDLTNAAEVADEASDLDAAPVPPVPPPSGAQRRAAAKDATEAPKGGAAAGKEPVSEIQVLRARWRRLAARAQAKGVGVPVLPEDADADAITAAGKDLQRRLGGAPGTPAEPPEAAG
jgi:hypothetical protein